MASIELWIGFGFVIAFFIGKYEYFLAEFLRYKIRQWHEKAKVKKEGE